MARSKSVKSKRKNKNSKSAKLARIFSFSTTKGKFLIFILTFAVIGGGYMAYQSFAATSSGGKFIYYQGGTDSGTYAANYDGTEKVKVGPDSVNVPITRHVGGNFVGLGQYDSSIGRVLGKIYTIDGTKSYQFGSFGSCDTTTNRTRNLNEISFRKELAGSIPRLAYIQENRLKAQPNCTGGDAGGLFGNSQVVAINSDGTNKNVVSVADRFYHSLTWSPDGRVYWQDCALNNSSCKLVYYIAGKTTTLVGDVYDYSLSGNGKTLIYETYANYGSLFKINVDGTGKKTLLSGAGDFSIYPGSLSGAGSTYVYSQRRADGKHDIRMARSDIVSNKVVDSAVSVRDITWSPGNDMVMYSKWDDTTSLIARMTADGSSKTRVISFPDRSASDIDW